MSEALRKKFRRLWGDTEDVSQRGHHASLQPGPALRLVPVELLVEPVPVALQGVRWETWGTTHTKGASSPHTALGSPTLPRAHTLWNPQIRETMCDPRMGSSSD